MNVQVATIPPERSSGCRQHCRVGPTNPTAAHTHKIIRIRERQGARILANTAYTGAGLGHHREAPPAQRRTHTHGQTVNRALPTARTPTER